MRSLSCVCAAAALSAFSLANVQEISFVEYDLDNGLHVILHQNNEAPVVSSYLLYHVGSKDERPDRTGFAHFFEHLMFEGTENIDRGEIQKLVDGSGGNMNASTSNDRTDYYINLPSNQLELALWIESERLLHARINEKGVETQREVVKEERRSRYDNQPYGSIYENMSKLVFAGTPYEWTPIGSVQYIDQATIEEFREFYRKWYVPNNAILSIAGDIDVEKTKKLVEKYFGDIPAGERLERPSFEWSLDVAPSSMVVEEPLTPLPAALHLWRAPAMTHSDAKAIELLMKILAEGNSSRLYRRIVDLEQAAVDSSAFNWMSEKAGMLAVFAIGNPTSSLERLDTLIVEELEKLLEGGVSDEELRKALNQIETEIASAFGTMSSRSQNLAHYHQWFDDTDKINTELDEYREITKEDIVRVAKEYLRQERRFTIHYAVPSQ